MRLILKKILLSTLLLLACAVFAGCSLPQIEVPGASDKKGGPYTVKVYSCVQDAQTGAYVETLVGTHSIEKGGEFTATPSIPQYHVYNSQRSVAFVTNVSKDQMIKLYYDCETCTVTFLSGGGQFVSGSETQVLRKGQTPAPPTYARAGYSFVGFDNEVCPVYEDTFLTAVWEIEKNYLTLQVPAGALILDSAYEKTSTSGNWVYHREITAESEFSLPTPYYDGGTFLGWKYNLADEEVVTAVSRGTTRSITLYADFGETP